MIKRKIKHEVLSFPHLRKDHLGIHHGRTFQREKVIQVGFPSSLFDGKMVCDVIFNKSDKSRILCFEPGKKTGDEWTSV